MKRLRTSTRLAAALAAFAVGAVGLLATTAEALPINTPPAGVFGIAPSSGTRTTAINISVPAGAACAGDSATNGYYESTFMVASTADASQLSYPSGNPTSANPTDFVQPLFQTGTPQVNLTTGIGTGAVTNLAQVDFGVFPANAVPAGQYKIGVACFLATTGALDKFWQTTIGITLDGAGVISGYSLFAVPSAPTLASPLTPGNGTLAGSFSAVASTPPATGYTVTAAPQPSGAAVTLPVAAPGAFTIPGLTNGTTYSVTVKGTNAAGTSPASNAVTGTPLNANQRPPVTSLTASPGAAGSAVLNWVAPTGTGTINNYTVGVNPTVAGAPFTTGGAVTTFTVNGLATGTSYTLTVTANYAGPEVGSPATVTFFATGAQVLIQDITVVRPAGALILTQRCGVYGALAAVPASSIPGFDAGFPALAASGTGGAAPTTGAAPGGPADPQFPAYPFPSPAAYPTHCGLDLGTGSYVTTGALAGQYYSANGRLNQVTVADNRDASFAGWTINAVMSTFGNGSSTFSGDNLGFIPAVSGFTAGQVVTAGAAVNPLTTPGLASGKTLASAGNAATARGIAQLDARILLLIPVSAAAGTFTGTLTLSAI